MLIDDPTEGLAERVERYAANFMGKYDIQPGDALVIASQSGLTRSRLKSRSKVNRWGPP